MQQRVLQTSVIEDDLRNDNVLRPQSLKDYVGQRDIKSNIKICIEAAKSRDEGAEVGGLSNWHSHQYGDKVL